MNGTAVADVLTGTTGADVIAGLEGNDAISGLDGNDLLYGNQDQDSIDAGAGSNTAYGGMGNDFIAAGFGSDLLFGNEGADTISAGDGDNTIVGGQDSTDGADLIMAGSGNDLILGNGGDDTISAGGGNDIVVAGFGADILLGNMGDDFVFGNQGNDTVFGGFGADTLIGGMGDDTLYGNEGNDVLYGNEGSNLIAGGDGEDIVVFSGARSSYVVVQNADGSFTLINSDGFNTVGSVEQFQFSDGIVAASQLVQAGETAPPAPPANRAPTANADVNSFIENSVAPLNGNVLINDTDPDGDPVTVTNPFMAAGAYGTLTLNQDGTYTYVPNAGPINGLGSGQSLTDVFNYSAVDPGGLSSQSSLTITVNGINDAPVANPDAFTTNEDVALTIIGNSLLSNDSDVDGNALTISNITQPSHGTILSNPDGTYTYTPNFDYNGIDSFTYKANDGSSDSAPAVVTINITPVNDAPFARSDAYTVPANAQFVRMAAGVLDNDSDVDNDSLTAALISGPSHGTLSLDQSGSFVYTPNTNYVGQDVFRYVANDGFANSATTSVILSVE